MQRDDVTADIRIFLRAGSAHQRVPGLGKGVVVLCEGVEKYGSLNRAAKEMGMAYSKAWRIVKSAEEALGTELFVRRGAHGSSLTPEAKALMKAYRRLEAVLSKTAEEALDEAFEEFAEEGLFTEQEVPDIAKKATPELIAQVKAIRP